MTKTHHAWLKTVKFEQRAQQFVFEQYLLSIEHLMEPIEHVDSEVTLLSQSSAYAEVIGWLRCFKGIDTVAAMTLVSEVHDFRRFESPGHLMSYLGLTPSEHSSGERKRQGGITKAGNTHARRVLEEIAWHYRHPASLGVGLRARRDGQPAWAISVADKAQLRLSRRYRKLVDGGKPVQKSDDSRGP